MKINDLTEIFINFEREDYDADDAIERALKAIDRPEIDGVLMPFKQGISVFIESVNDTELTLEEYKERVSKQLADEFGDSIGDIEFIF